MPPPAYQPNLAAYLSSDAATTASTAGSSQRSFMSSFTSGLWSVMTLGLGGSGSSSDAISANPSGTIVTYLPHLPSDAHSNPSGGGAGLTDTQIDSTNRLLAWQSCHILLVLSNHCTNESLYNPYRLALFHFTDTQGKDHLFLKLRCLNL